MNWNQEEEEEYLLSLSRFEAMLKTDKVFFFDSEEFEDIIFHYLDTGKTNLAKKALKLALEQHPKSTDLKLIQVEILVYENKLDLAEKILHELHELEPTNEEVYIQKANMYSKKGNHQKAVELLETALKYTDDYADVYSMIGMEYLFMDELEKAKENFILCLKEDNEDYSALYNIVYCFDFLEQYEEAIRFLNEFIDENPYSEVAWHQLGREYYILKEYELSVRAFDYAIVIDEWFLGAYMEKAKALEKLKRYEEAIVCYNHTLELNDPTAFAYLRIGKCYEKLKDRDSALKYYRKSVAEDPLLEKGWCAIIDLYVKEKNYKRALSYVSKALDIDDQNEQYWKRFGSLNYTLENYDDAYIGYEKSILCGSLDLDVYLIFSDMSMAFEKYEKAIEILTQYSEVFSGHHEIEYRLAGLHFILENEPFAMFHLNNALLSDFESLILFSEMFPSIYERQSVQNLIQKYRNNG